MTFPTNPTNGQSVTLNGVELTYNSTKTAWVKTTSGSGTVPATVSGTLTVTGNANVGNLGTGGLIVATGNVTGGNLVTSGVLSVTGNANVGNLGTAGSATSGIFIGNGSTTVSKFQASPASMANTDYNYIISAANDTGNKLVCFVNGSNRSADGGVNTVTLRNDGGGLRLGQGAALTTIEGSTVSISSNTIPTANATYNLGSATNRWSTVFTTDLELSNGIGDYTIVEGEDDLFIYNNKRGKVYKFALIEVDPKDAPPKAGRSNGN